MRERDREVLDVAQLVEHSPSIQEALGSIPSEEWTRCGGTHPQSSPQKWRQEDQTFKVILSYKVRSRPGPCAAVCAGEQG